MQTNGVTTIALLVLSTRKLITNDNKVSFTMCIYLLLYKSE